VNSRELAVIAAEAASDKKADDIIAINIAELLVVTDYFVIATGNTNIQVKAIAGEIEDQLRERGGVKPIGREGETEAKWVLLDYGDIVVHVFQPEERGFYRLEKLWGDAPRLALPASVVGRAPLGTVDPASASKRAEESAEEEQA
jgi:ribosome-associated protein